MPCCAWFDNPATMRREQWVDRRLVSWTSAEIILARQAPNFPWTLGHLDGDESALDSEALAIHRRDSSHRR